MLTYILLGIVILLQLASIALIIWQYRQLVRWIDAIGEMAGDAIAAWRDQAKGEGHEIDGLGR